MPRMRASRLAGIRQRRHDARADPPRVALLVRALRRVLEAAAADDAELHGGGDPSAGRSGQLPPDLPGDALRPELRTARPPVRCVLDRPAARPPRAHALAVPLCPPGLGASPSASRSSPMFR